MDFMNPDDLTPEMLDRLREFVPQFEVNAGQLRRVIPIGQAVEVSGTRVELIAMEIRDSGAIVYWKAFTDQERMIGPIQARVSDDRGTDYIGRTPLVLEHLKLYAPSIPNPHKTRYVTRTAGPLDLTPGACNIEATPDGGYW